MTQPLWLRVFLRWGPERRRVGSRAPTGGVSGAPPGGVSGAPPGGVSGAPPGGVSGARRCGIDSLFAAELRRQHQPGFDERIPGQNGADGEEVGHVGDVVDA